MVLNRVLIGGAIAATATVLASDCTRTSVGLWPLPELGQGLYLNQYQGGLYPNGSNAMPQAHRAAGLLAAANIVPRDAAGNPADTGRVVMVSIGMSNTTQEFCGGTYPTCQSFSFIGQAAADPRVNHTTLRLVDGARGGQTAGTWDSPTDTNYDIVRDQRLAPQGLTEAQVQAVWIKVANSTPTRSLPDPQSDAFTLVTQMGNIARAAKVRYPNLKLAFFSSRIYAGYASTALNPEPYAYESGFAVKWAIEAQIRQMGGQGIDPRAGDLDYNTVAPVMAWGPYLWGDGTTPRWDGLVWNCSDLTSDGTHPSNTGREKVADLLMAHFLNSPLASHWFRTPTPCDPDVNCDGAENGFDIAAMEQAVNGDMSDFCQADPDFNHDGAINGFDVEAVEQGVNGAACP
ncbi:hypothetical protein PHYC_01758 [Phycisphaerales bacterium]|nr:hypothetical protein PHYC_01758 [Phycisphaerales bacterium]